jgi:hypothetical protein
MGGSDWVDQMEAGRVKCKRVKMLKSAPKCPKLIPEIIMSKFRLISAKICVYDAKSPNSVKNWCVPNNIIVRPVTLQ